jgi:RNA polymerase sigma factor (sigma-70 family)
MNEEIRYSTSSSKKDGELVKAFQAGDKTVFDAIVLRHKDKLYNMCYWFLGDRQEANDSAQEVFIKVFRSLKRFRFESAFSTWFYPQTKALIDEHLLACPKCNEEFASLKALIRELGSMESFKAPDDFLEKIHERLEPWGSFRKIMRILFVPGRIKIPLELATAVAMAVLIFSILYIQQPEKMVSDVPESSTHVKVTEKTSMDRVSPSGKGAKFNSKPVIGKATAQQPVKKREIIELTLLLEKEGPGEAYAPSESIEAAPARQRDAERSRMARLTAPKTEMKTDTLRRKKQVTGFTEEKRPVLEEESRASFSSLHDTFIKVKELIMLAEGRTLSLEYEPHTERPQSIRAEIPANNFTSFCDKLSRLAILHTSPPTISEKDQGTIQIRIRFISS